MNYILTEKQIDKIMKPFWDYHFNDSNFVEDIKGSDDWRDWSGFIKKLPNGHKILLVGFIKSSPDMWYSDGSYFYNSKNMFNLTPHEFHNSMKRYLKNKFGFNIDKIM
jgi:hypothetical protein